MPQKIIKFKGINRRINEFQASGECEELINLRPEVYGGHSVVRQKKVLKYAVPYVKLYDHSFGNIRNTIAVTSSGRVDYIEEDGDVGTITDALSGRSVSVATAGNVVVIYADNPKEQLVFKCNNGRYEPYNVSIKNISSVSIDYDYVSSNPASNNSTGSLELTSGGINEALSSAASGFYRKFPNGLCGASVIGCTYELEDGSEIWSTGFIVANVTRCAGYKHPNINLDGGGIIVYGASKVTLKLSFEDIKTENIKKINVYASRPVLPYEGGQDSNSSISIKKTPLDETNLGKDLMYYQGSVALDKTSAELVLDFSEKQLGESVMEVTSGCIERIGKVISYNNRFHFYNSDVNHVIQVPTLSDVTGDGSSWIAYAKINDKWRLVNKVYTFSESTPNDFVYPMSGVSQIAFVKGIGSGGGFQSSYDTMFYVDLRDSASYNYSYAFDVTPNLVQVGDFEDKIDAENQQWGNAKRTTLLKNEANAINVSAQYNPYVFPVEYSYSVTGEILDIATSYMPVSSTQVGQYPLSIFTTSGVFALEQGDGSVLYSNITPLQPYAINGKATSTPFGTFFLSSKNLYLLSGRETANVSYVLGGSRELPLRNTESYQKICCNKTGVFYDFSPILSSTDFEEFAKDASLVYDQLHNELYICSNNSSIPYSYVFNLDTRTFHKVIKKFLYSQSGMRYAIEEVGSRKMLVDMFTEEHSEQPIFLQSRPFALEALFTHIQRMILYTDAHLESIQNICLTVFASDNLYDWKCIISSQKKETILRHIRTNRAAKSYRDYVVVISGTVSTDTDISDLLVDYTAVNRRLV